MTKKNGQPMILEFNKQSYKEEDVDSFINESPKIFEIRKQPILTFAETSTTIITLVLLTPLIYFMRGFFTKIGETFAEEIKADFVEVYRVWKEKFIRLIGLNTTRDIPTFMFNLRMADVHVEILGSITSSDKNIISIALDSGKELHDLAVEKITNIQVTSNHKIQSICYKFNSDKKIWEFSFAQTESLKVIK